MTKAAVAAMRMKNRVIAASILFPDGMLHGSNNKNQCRFALDSRDDRFDPDRQPVARE